MPEYLSALWMHWVALMSGIIGLLIGLGLRIGRRTSETIKGWSDIPDWIFICIGLVGLFWAGYAAWQDKNQALIALEQKLQTPKFGGRLGAVFRGTRGSRGKDKPLVIVGGTITNPLGPASGVIDWKMGIKFPDSRVAR